MGKSKDITEEGWARLCAEVIRYAISDYLSLSKKIESARAHGREPKIRDVDDLDGIERFFHSERFHLFAGNVEFEYFIKEIPELRSLEEHEE